MWRYLVLSCFAASKYSACSLRLPGVSLSKAEDTPCCRSASERTLGITTFGLRSGLIRLSSR